MKFKISFIFPVIVIVLAAVSVFYLTEIEPFNYVIAAVVFVLALAMAWRIYYDLTSMTSFKGETEYEPSSNVTDLLKESPKESKINLNDFLKSSPKDLDSRDFGKEFDFGEEQPLSPLEKQEKTEKKTKDPFAVDSLVNEEKYKQMKDKALKELKNVIKPKKDKKK